MHTNNMWYFSQGGQELNKTSFDLFTNAVWSHISCVSDITMHQLNVQ